MGEASANDTVYTCRLSIGTSEHRNLMTFIHKPDSWLEQLFLKAKELRWCVDPYCTTCGCMEFRTTYLTEARRRAGFPPAVDGVSRSPSPRELIDELSREGRAATFEELARAVCDLPREATHGNAFRPVMIDLDAPLLRWGVVVTLSSRLEGTPAGDALAEMLRHSENRSKTRALRAEFDGPEATAKRRAERARQNAERNEARRREQQSRNQSRLELLQKLTAMSSTERLEWLAAQPPGFPLESIPTELIADGLQCGQVSATVAHDLVRRIGQRRGAWAGIRRQLESSS